MDKEHWSQLGDLGRCWLVRRWHLPGLAGSAVSENLGVAGSTQLKENLGVLVSNPGQVWGRSLTYSEDIRWL